MFECRKEKLIAFIIFIFRGGILLGHNGSEEVFGFDGMRSIESEASFCMYRSCRSRHNSSSRVVNQYCCRREKKISAADSQCSIRA